MRIRSTGEKDGMIVEIDVEIDEDAFDGRLDDVETARHAHRRVSEVAEESVRNLLFGPVEEDRPETPTGPTLTEAFIRSLWANLDRAGRLRLLGSAYTLGVDVPDDLRGKS